MNHRDPVCDMEVRESEAAGTSQFKGDTYYFCSESCKERFDQDPDRYVSRSQSSQT